MSITKSKGRTAQDTNLRELLKLVGLLVLIKLSDVFARIAHVVGTDVKKISISFLCILLTGLVGILSWLDHKIIPAHTSPSIEVMSAPLLPLPIPKSQNEAAPVAAKQLTKVMCEAYINRFYKTAQAEMVRFGIPASISLAQGLVESRAGDSKLARQNNNHFGIKCFSRRCKKGHCSNFTDDTHKDFFRVFASPWESWRAHSQMLASGRYTKLKRYGRDYRQWAYGLKAAGYATDRTYAEKLIGVIEQYELYQYDK